MSCSCLSVKRLSNSVRAVTQVQNAYSSRDITFMHNHIEHVLSNETLNENQLCAERRPRVAR